jgi:glutamyl/glutaminyl-tRNA synthetase
LNQSSRLIKTRLAPTPSGYLHVGNAYNFLLIWLHARLNNGRIRLRIDDIDAPRVRAPFLKDIFDTLEWLGIDWDEGPFTMVEQQMYSQHQRIERYMEVLNTLINQDLLFACICSRSLLRRFGPNGTYKGTCKQQQIAWSHHPASWRCDTDSFAEIKLLDHTGSESLYSLPSDMAYAILKRKDGLPAYQLCSLVDDIDFGINYIVRGSDLLSSSIFQMGLSNQMGPNLFKEIHFFHHPLILDASGKKLSKSKGSAPLWQLRQQRGGREMLIASFSRWLQLPEKVTSTKELLALASACSY